MSTGKAVFKRNLKEEHSATKQSGPKMSSVSRHLTQNQYRKLKRKGKLK